MNKEVVKELIQDELNTSNLVAELNLLLNDKQKQQQIAADYTALKNLLQLGGKASEKAAKSIYSYI